MGSDVKAHSASMAKVGERLRESREKKGVTIDQVQKQTRIHSTVLKALEEGRCDDVLTPTYVKSFLKKYAEYLGLDTRQALTDYAAGMHEGQSVQVTTRVEPVSGSNFSIPPGFIKTAVFVVVAIFLAAFIGPQVKSLIGKIKAGRVQPAVKTKAKSSPVKQAAQPKKKASAGAQAPVQKEPAKAQPAASQDQNLRQQAPKAQPVRLFLKVNQNVRIKLKADGNLLFDRVLAAGVVENFTAKDRINIFIARGEAVELIVNGRNFGSPGKGLLRDVEITGSGMKIK